MVLNQLPVFRSCRLSVLAGLGLVALAACEFVISSPSRVSLSWDSNTEIVDGYMIFIGTSEDTQQMTKLQNIEPQVGDRQEVTYNSLSDVGASKGQPLCFRLKAYQGDLISDFSEAACAIP